MACFADINVSQGSVATYAMGFGGRTRPDWGWGGHVSPMPPLDYATVSDAVSSY